MVAAWRRAASVLGREQRPGHAWLIADYFRSGAELGLFGMIVFNVPIEVSCQPRAGTERADRLAGSPQPRSVTGTTSALSCGSQQLRNMTMWVACSCLLHSMRRCLHAVFMGVKQAAVLQPCAVAIQTRA